MTRGRETSATHCAASGSPRRAAGSATRQYIEERRTITATAHDIGCIPGSVSRALRRHGLRDVHWRGPIPELADSDWLRARYIDEGLSTAQIAALLDCGSPAVRVALIRAGIDRRPPGGWWQSPAMRNDLTGR